MRKAAVLLHSISSAAGLSRTCFLATWSWLKALMNTKSIKVLVVDRYTRASVVATLLVLWGSATAAQTVSSGTTYPLLPSLFHQHPSASAAAGTSGRVCCWLTMASSMPYGWMSSLFHVCSFQPCYPAILQQPFCCLHSWGLCTISRPTG